MHSSHNWNLNSLGSFRKSVTGFAAERSGIDNRAQEKFTVKVLTNFILYFCEMVISHPYCSFFVFFFILTRNPQNYPPRYF